MNINKIDGMVDRRRGEPDPVDIHVGSRIRTRRILLGQSQENIASQLGISFQQLQKYESGANRISASRLYDVAYILDVPVAYFFDEMPETVRYPDGEGKSMPADGNAETHALPIPAVLQNRTTLDLIRDFYRIGSSHQQRCVLDLIRAMAEMPAGRPEL
jgi:transcriptional regulator with XRE-family HTH domain